MFRRWLSKFKRENKNKFEILFKLFLIVGVILFSVYLVFSNMKDNEKDNNQIQTVYKPQQTIISGNNVSQEEYETDSNIVNKFVDYCNNGNINQAYELLTDECKENLYPTLDDFKVKYCDRYFSEKRDYNLQSWVNKGKNMTYQMRITQDILSLGQYQTDSTYQDYITIVESENNKKININGYITRNYINKTTKAQGIEIKVNQVDVYMDYEEYTLEITNNTESIIILDDMKYSKSSLAIISTDDRKSSVIPNSISYIKLITNPGETKKIKIQFNKAYSNDEKSEYMQFSKIVKNYNEFIKNQEDYNDFIEIKVEL